MLKVGDNIIIKSEEQIKELPFDNAHKKHSSKNGVLFVDEMYKDCNKVAKITEVRIYSKGYVCYRINCSGYSWDEDFFVNTCGFCKGDEYIFNGVRLYRSDNNLVIDGQEIEIEFCPFCGKKL